MPGPENGARLWADGPSGMASGSDTPPGHDKFDKAMRRNNIILVVLLPLLAACSVKEDRDVCPCWLQIDLSTCSHYADRVALKGWTSSSPVFGVQVLGEDFSTAHEEEVPRTMVSYCATSGLDASRNSGMSVIVPEGNQSDRLYAYRADVPAFGETAYDKVSLHKQYAAVAIKIDDASTDYSVKVRGGWNGLDLVTLKPLAGAFEFVPEKTEDRVWYFRLPRQGDDSLVMDITDRSGYTYPYDLGALIRESGYDWDAEDLDDIMIGVDYHTGQMTIRVIPWEEGLVYDEII